VSTQKLAMTDVSRKNLVNVDQKDHWSASTEKTWMTTVKKILGRRQQKILMTDVSEKITLTNII